MTTRTTASTAAAVAAAAAATSTTSPSSTSTANIACPSVRLALIKALANTSSNRNRNRSNSKSRTCTTSNTTTTGGNSPTTSQQREHAASSRRICRWWRQQQRRVHPRPRNVIKNKRKRDDGETNAKDDEAEESCSRNNKRPRNNKSIHSSHNDSSDNDSGDSSDSDGIVVDYAEETKQTAIFLRILQASPSTSERLQAAHCLLAMINTKKSSSNCSSSTSVITSSSKESGRKSGGGGENDDEDVAEYKAFALKQQLCRMVQTAASAQSSSSQQQQQFVLEAMALWQHLMGVLDSGASSVVCRSDWDAVATSLAQFVAQRNTVAALACAEWCRNAVLVVSTNGNDNKDNNKNERHSKIVSWRNQTWLWKSLEEQTADATTTTSAPFPLSPLACLVGAYYSLHDFNATAGLRGADTLRNVLALLVDPTQTPTTVSSNSSNTSSSSSQRKQNKKKQAEEENNEDDDDDDPPPPPLIPAGSGRRREGAGDEALSVEELMGEENENEDADDDHVQEEEDDHNPTNQDNGGGEEFHAEDEQDQDEIESMDEEEEEGGQGEGEEEEENEQGGGEDEEMCTEEDDTVAQEQGQQDHQEEHHQESASVDDCPGLEQPSGAHEDQDDDNDDEDGDGECEDDDQEHGDDDDDDDEECNAEDDEDDDEDDDDQDEECDDEDEDDDEDGDDTMEIELSELEMAVVEQARRGATRATSHTATSNNNSSSNNGNGNISSKSNSTVLLVPPLPQRQRLLLQASMQVLAAHYPQHQPHNHHQQQQQQTATASASSSSPFSQQKHQQPASNNNHFCRKACFLTIPSETALLESMNAIVKPPKKPISTKIILRRAPTQEEFFRGSLTRNPVTIDSLRGTTANAGRDDAIQVGGGDEPTVADLRNHIARDLQMADSAELIEILVANKILDVSLKLRVVHQVLWRNHLLEHNNSNCSAAAGTGAGGLASLVSHTSGLAMIFSSGLERLVGGGLGSTSRSSNNNITADTPLSQLPAMVATYRLAGVDGEATEDTVATLDDPEEAPRAASAQEREALLEKEYGLTRLVTQGRGVFVLLRSVQHAIGDALRRIRRDAVDDDMSSSNTTTQNNNTFSRGAFFTKPCAGLVLLRHCSQLASNRKLLLKARAPTVLLNLLLDVLKVLEGHDSNNNTSSSNTKSNPTADILQELIEGLSSDISTTSSNNANNSTSQSSEDDADVAEVEGYTSEDDDGAQQDAASMPLLLESIETISLSLPLRHVIAKLLPFLTYGQADLSRTLAQHFDRNICVESLAACESNEEQLQLETCRQNDDSDNNKNIVLMKTFVETAISLPPNNVCSSLRTELVGIGFIERLVRFILQDMPKQPPPWSPALTSGDNKTTTSATPSSSAGSNKKKRSRRNSNKESNNVQALEEVWREYFLRGGVRTALKILTGLCRKHAPTQSRIAAATDFVRSCHWLEATSDNTNAISTGGLGLLAETLLDEMAVDNPDVVKIIEATRKKTRLRKRELAQERRNQALHKMGSFRPGMANAASLSSPPAATATLQQSSSSSVRGAAASILAPVLGLFSNPSETAASTTARSSSASFRGGKARDSNKGGAAAASASSPEKPSWLVEMEAMKDDVGLTCAVCQEGRTLQPSELLGLYAYVKKVFIPLEQCGSRAGIDGSTLLRGLPSSMPETLVGDPVAEEWYLLGKAASENLSASDSVSSSRKNTSFTTTVSAGNAIHFSCHRTARQADRNHPKAPKSEWEGAMLRNNRVSCNVILPLVSSRSSRVPLIAVETALTEHQSAVSNLLGSTPKSMLWTVLHDVRLLLLRLAYGEPLNSDCGGGSLFSNCQLVFYQLLFADMYDKDAQADQPPQSQHARGLPAGFLAACHMVAVKSTSEQAGSSLMRGIADCAPMAALNCIVFHNTKDNEGTSSTGSAVTPHPKRLWLMAQDYFLRGLLICGGRRHALGIEGSGCQTTRRHTGGQGLRSEWELGDAAGGDDESRTVEGTLGRSVLTRSNRASSSSATTRRQTKLSIEDFQNALRPVITLYAIMDQISSDFTLNMEDVRIEESADRLVHVIEECRKARNIHELLEKAKVSFAHEEMIDLLHKGMIAA